MAAAIKALNARIRANPVLDYFCSTRESYPDCAADIAKRRIPQFRMVVLEDQGRHDWR
jgi:hypothetical protein